MSCEEGTHFFLFRNISHEKKGEKKGPIFRTSFAFLSPGGLAAFLSFAA